MPKMHIDRSIIINAPVDKVYSTLNDYHNWSAWSPWLIMEREAKVTVAEDGKHYSWEGDKVGAGEMTITNEDANTRLDMDLMFLKPWKSEAKVWFTFKSNDEGSTTVNWYMDSSLPFYLFWMTKMTVAFISMDYDRGLSMLKDYVETGTVPSHLDFETERSFNSTDYVGIKTSCKISDLGDRMSADFEKLNHWVEENKDSVTGPPFSIYHKWDIVKGDAEYTSAYPVSSVPVDLSQGLHSEHMPAVKAYIVNHTGPYKHLGNAWSAGYNLVQNKKIKQNKKIHPFELYENNPMDTPENELKTSICFPLK